MDRRDAEQKAEKPERAVSVGGGTAESSGAARQAVPAPGEQTGDEAPKLMEEVLRDENLKAAYKRVVSNGGAGGMDGRSVDDLKHQIREDWPRIREELLSERYVPKPVRRVEIPKTGGGVRVLGIPTVMDRMIQQALLQALTPIFDPTFSEDSYGFRPGRSAHQAVLRGKEHIEAGYRWVVDLDLEKFFDTVQHDVLMSRVARPDPTSVKRLKGRLKDLFRRGRGWSLAHTVRELRPILKGWVTYVRLADVTGVFRELDQWIRRRLRLILWRQWKRPRTRRKELLQRGLREARASISAYNGRGAWWNAGASHMNHAVPTSTLHQMGLVSLSQEHRRLRHTS